MSTPETTSCQHGTPECVACFVTRQLQSSLAEFLRECAQNTDLLHQYDRLRGTNLCGRGSPITIMIDQATGHFESECNDFFRFCTSLWLHVAMDAPASAKVAEDT